MWGGKYMQNNGNSWLVRLGTSFKPRTTIRVFFLLVNFLVQMHFYRCQGLLKDAHLVEKVKFNCSSSVG